MHGIKTKIGHFYKCKHFSNLISSLLKNREIRTLKSYMNGLETGHLDAVVNEQKVKEGPVELKCHVLAETLKKNSHNILQYEK
jgi:hypothetical protein